MTHTQGIYIDGTLYDVPLVEITRKAEFLDKFANRSEDGDLKRELIGVYINYDLELGTIDDSDLYETLWDKLTEPVEFHDFTLPDSKKPYSFRGYITGVSDKMDKIYKNDVLYKGLKFSYIAKAPARTPG